MARWIVCSSMERDPVKVQYCFGIASPSHCLISGLKRVPFPPANMIDHIRGVVVPVAYTLPPFSSMDETVTLTAFFPLTGGRPP